MLRSTRPRILYLLRLAPTALLAAAILSCAAGGEVSSSRARGLPGASRLSVRGREILAPDGEPIRLRGFNVLWWASPDSQAASDIVEVGANCVRYMFGYEPSGRFEPEKLAFVRDHVRTFTSRGLWVFVTVHRFERKRGEKKLQPWDSAEVQREFLDMWTHVVRQLRNEPLIAGWEPLNEPHDVEGETLARWYRGVVAHLRSLDPRTPVVVDCGDWSNPWGMGDYLFMRPASNGPAVLQAASPTAAARSALLPGPLEAGFVNERTVEVRGPKMSGSAVRPAPPISAAQESVRPRRSAEPVQDVDFANVIYSFHMYSPHDFTHQEPDRPTEYPGEWGREYLARQIAPAVSFREKFDVPVWCGEWGCITRARGFEGWLGDVASILEEHDFHWTHWAWVVKAEPVNDTFDVNKHKTGIYNVLRKAFREAGTRRAPEPGGERSGSRPGEG